MTVVVPLNINSRVFFKLTDAGREIWNVEESPMRAAAIGETTTAQLWDFMQIFGPHLHMGMTEPLIQNNALTVDLEESPTETRVRALEGELLRCNELRVAVFARAEELAKPISMRLICPRCATLHLDAPPWDARPHHTHACQSCGEVWRPAIPPTVGVRFLPGFRNEEPQT